MAAMTYDQSGMTYDGMCTYDGVYFGVVERVQLSSSITTQGIFDSPLTRSITLQSNIFT